MVERDKFGTVYHKNDKGELHCDNGPAVIYYDVENPSIVRCEVFFLNGKEISYRFYVKDGFLVADGVKNGYARQFRRDGSVTIKHLLKEKIKKENAKKGW